jgi:hypothetical protein
MAAMPPGRAGCCLQPVRAKPAANNNKSIFTELSPEFAVYQERGGREETGF